MMIIGASRGLGAALNLGVPEAGDSVYLVSRNPSDVQQNDGVERRWIQADLAQVDAADVIASTIGEQTTLDVLIYNAGIWEDHAFNDNYDFGAVPVDTTERVLTVNLTAAIHCLTRLLPNVRRSANGKIILIGSINGLENTRMLAVAYSASKFGLRGVAHALRENVREDRIAVTCINPGTIGDTYIPYDDLVKLVKCLVSLSNQTCVKELDVPAMVDPNV